MVISAQETAASQPPRPLTVGPTPPPPHFSCFPISQPHNHPRTVKSDVAVAPPSRPWNLRPRSNGSAVLDQLKERPRFSLALTCDEIAEDIYAVTGLLPQRRPKKRPRLVQKQIEVN
jgi:Protein of unknown function (DUF1639)